jgi:hypothetical protein
VGAPAKVLELVEQFGSNIDHYRASTFKETPTREQFINPLFEALGWNVRSRGLSETEKEVVLEQSVSVGSTKKSVDYAFRVDGVNKFVCEAKPPHKSLASDKSPALQVRRYAWNLGLPLGIVTDFEEFAVYDCRGRPDSTAGVLSARIEFVRFDEYDSRWDWMAEHFSRDAVLGGSVDVWAAETKPPKGTMPVNAAFLDSINRWRSDLANDLVKRNPSITEAELNFAVQATIDRVIFLRICEDRGLEREGDLRDTTSGADVYEHLLDLFNRADQRYNSGLFHFQTERDRPGPDVVTPTLKVGDEVLRGMIGKLYGTNNVFEFRIIPTDILGRVYEQVLGKVIVRSSSTIEVVEKPEVRKAGGVYYTPEWVVDYMVQESLAPLLKGASVDDVAKLKVLDPACGSGSFLLGAFEHLLDWHLSFYAANSSKYKKHLTQDAFGNLRLTLPERRRILLNNIHGVDIDSQAVEVAKLSLLLKVIEGENQLAFGLGRLLPDLDANIKQGNSLVSTDLYGIVDVPSLSTEQMRTLVPFDWASAFPKAMANGGFDLVIGNPPYLSVDATWGASDPRLTYLKSAYAEVYNDKTDLLYYFLKRAVDLSRRETAMIVSRAFLEAFKADRLRGWLGENVKVREIVDFQNAQVFPGVGITTAIVRFTHAARPGKAAVRQLIPSATPAGATPRFVRDGSQFKVFSVPQKSFGAASWTFADPAELEIFEQIDASGVPVGSVLHIGQGMQTGANTVFGGLSPDDVSDWSLPDSAWFHRARNSDILRWHITSRDEILLYPDDYTSVSQLPSGAQSYLNSHRTTLRGRKAYERGNCDWWKYTWPLHAQYVRRPRILCPYLAKANRFALDETCRFLGLTDTTILYDDGQPEDLRWFVGFLNSKALTFRFHGIGKLKSSDIREYFENTVRQLPIPRTTPASPDHSKMVGLVNKAMAAAESMHAATTQVDRDMYQAQLEGIEKATDALVYELYGLTSAQIATVELAVG